MTSIQSLGSDEREDILLKKQRIKTLNRTRCVLALYSLKICVFTHPHTPYTPKKLQSKLLEVVSDKRIISSASQASQTTNTQEICLEKDF